MTTVLFRLREYDDAFRDLFDDPTTEAGRCRFEVAAIKRDHHVGTSIYRVWVK